MGMALLAFREALRLDLKDSGSLWSDGELNRCIERSVDDLSRFIPNEKVYEDTLSFTVSGESITSPETTSLVAIVNAQSINVAAGNLLTISGQPDIPRALRITIIDANDSTYGATFKIRGSDRNGQAIEEVFQYARGYSKTLQGKKEFKYVYEVELDQDYGSGAGDTASVGYGLFTDPYIYLGYKPIRPETETVTSSPAGTTYTRDTDYVMDYINGRIKLKAGGSMAASTAYLISYTKSRLGVDISAIIPTLTRIQRVEYPVDIVPQQFVSFSIWGDFMYLGSKKTNVSQEEIPTTIEHIAIYYESKHTPPGEFSSGTYPEHLDEVVAIGANAYALLMKAIQYEHQAVTDLASLRTELGYTTDVHASFVTAIGKVNTYLANNSNEDSKYWLTKITTDIAGLRTALLTAVDAANTYLDDVDTTDFTGSGNDSSEGALKAGEDKIDAVNVGEQVGALYADYARTWQNNASMRTQAAVGYIQEASMRLQNLQSYISQAEGWSNIALGFVQEAQQRLNEISAYLEEARLYAETVNGDLVLADRFKADGLERLNEFYAILKSRQEWRKRVAIVAVHQPA